MPLLETHTQSECRWGLWRIDETGSELLDGLERRDAYRDFLENVRAEGRRTEWLAVRALLRVLLGYEPTVNYRPEGYIRDTMPQPSVPATQSSVLTSNGSARASSGCVTAS